MRRPGSSSMVTLASRCASVSQNGQPVRLNCQRVPQQPHESRRLRPGSAPTSWAIAGRDPHVGQYRRSHRSSSRQPSKAFTTGRRNRAIAVHARYRNSPGNAGVSVSSPSRKSTMRRETCGLAPQFRVERAGLRREASRRRSGGQSFREALPPFAHPVRDRRRRRRSTAAAHRRESRRGNPPSRECARRGRRSPPPRDRPARRGRRPAGGTNAPPASDPASSAQCASLGSARERTGM